LGGLGVAQSDEAIARAAQSLWNSSSDTLRKSDAHWRGAGSFSNDDLWLNIGRGNLARYRSFGRAIEFDRELHTIVDWGCGGGANAVQFGPLSETYFGVDVSAASLDECRRQATAAGTLDFRPVLIEVDQPEAALDLIGRSCDLFLCTYVFELVPTREYGLRILRIAERLLAPGGMAFVQIKYDTGSWRTAPYRRSYLRNFAAMTTYRIDQFWLAAESCGLTPRLVELVPDDALDPRYAYFLLVKQPDKDARAEA
jgi:2-polyprenyl-3-methyl-5-hydroxy-6-metoxy-1,4-benzoquinol methylase